MLCQNWKDWVQKSNTLLHKIEKGLIYLLMEQLFIRLVGALVTQKSRSGTVPFKCMYTKILYVRKFLSFCNKRKKRKLGFFRLLNTWRWISLYSKWERSNGLIMVCVRRIKQTKSRTQWVVWLDDSDLLDFGHTNIVSKSCMAFSSKKSCMAFSHFRFGLQSSSNIIKTVLLVY